MSFDYDLFVIGGGSGGVRAARLAASEGNAKVGLAEEYRMGGTCVIRGCVPKKLMVFASTYRDLIEDARAYGWDATAGDFDWNVFRPKMHAELDRLENIYRNILKTNHVEAYDARAEIKDAHTVRLSTGQEITAKHILVATGGTPFTPDVEGAEHTITSNEVFLLDQLPKSILIVGGGFIACEFACIMHGLGVKVTQFYRGEMILRGFDKGSATHIADAMKARGIDLRLGADVAKIEKTDAGLVVTDKSGAQETFGAVMYGTGRVPATKGMGLEEAGVNLGRKGEILVDNYSQSSVPSIYGVGDVTDRINLTPVAIREGAAFVETVFKANPTPVDHELVPSAVFTLPEFGTTGMTEEEAVAYAAEHGPVEVYSTAFKAMQSGFAGRENKVFMKLLVDQHKRTVLGCHLVMDGAGELIQLAGIPVKMGATKEDFDRTCAVHPTMAEELVTMKTPSHVIGGA